jgi:hypothetical protein
MGTTMTNTSSFHVTAHSFNLNVTHGSWARVLAWIVAATAAILAANDPALAAATPASGDTYVYRLTDGYTKVVRGQISYRVDAVDTNRMVMAVTADTPSAGMARTDVYTNEGNWLRHPLINHDQPVEYEFATAYPAYLFPLEVGKSWSLRVDATDPATGRRNSVRVDGEVMGSERIRVPAGEFDTIKVRRLVYAGDTDFFRKETNIQEIDWYAPALGRAVRTASTSNYLDANRSRCCKLIQGDWDIYELVALPAPVR